MVSFLQTAKAVLALEPSTHWIHEAAFAERLGISIDDLEGWTKCVREGGSGAVSNNTFKANPEPYNVKIDLLDQSADNTFNLHYQVNRCYTTPKTDGVTVLFRPAKYYFIGTSESCRSTSLMTEIEITSKVRNEMKRLSQETEVIRDVNSSTRLLDFATTYPQTFDMFWSKMGMYPHSTRIVEQCHGVERNAYNSQASHDMRDARTNYIANEEYDNRCDRRQCILKIEASKAVPTEQSKKQRTSSVKHNDRKVTQQMAGEQLLEGAKQYTTEQLAKRLPEEIRQKFSIKSIVKRGTDVGKKALDEKKVEHAEGVARKKRESTTFSQTPLEDLIEDAQKLETANDLAWKSKDAIKHAKQLNTVLTKSYWSRIKVDCFFEELEKVFPCFYTPTVSRMTKTDLLKRPTSACTAKNNLNLFIKLVKDIAEGKAPNTLSTKRRAEQLKRAKATKLDLWAEFANVEASEYLSVAEEKAFEKNALMRDVIASFGTETTTHARFQMTKADLTTTYTTDYVPPSDDGHDDEP